MEDKDLITLTETVERSKSNTHQIEDIKDEIKEIKSEQKAIYEIAASVKLIAQDMGSMKESINEVKQGQSKLEQKIDEVDEKSKVDFVTFLKTKFLPIAFSGGCLYLLIEIIMNFTK